MTVKISYKMSVKSSDLTLCEAVMYSISECHNFPLLWGNDVSGRSESQAALCRLKAMPAAPDATHKQHYLDVDRPFLYFVQMWQNCAEGWFTPTGYVQLERPVQTWRSDIHTIPVSKYCIVAHMVFSVLSLYICMCLNIRGLCCVCVLCLALVLKVIIKRHRRYVQPCTRVKHQGIHHMGLKLQDLHVVCRHRNRQWVGGYSATSEGFS